MSVHAKDLAKDELRGAGKVFWESTSATRPLFDGILVEEVCCRRGRVFLVKGKRNTVRVGRKHGAIVNFPRDPSLHEGHVFVGGEIHGLVVLVEPGI